MVKKAKRKQKKGERKQRDEKRRETTSITLVTTNNLETTAMIRLCLSLPICYVWYRRRE